MRSLLQLLSSAVIRGHRHETSYNFHVTEFLHVTELFIIYIYIFIIFYPQPSKNAKNHSLLARRPFKNGSRTSDLRAYFVQACASMVFGRAKSYLSFFFSFIYGGCRVWRLTQQRGTETTCPWNMTFLWTQFPHLKNRRIFFFVPSCRR